jgi:hypothetical protein
VIVPRRDWSKKEYADARARRGSEALAERAWRQDKSSCWALRNTLSHWNMEEACGVFDMAAYAVYVHDEIGFRSYA